MSKRYEQELGPVIVAIAGIFLLFVAIVSGVMPWAILLGALVFTGVLIYTREWRPALAAGSIVAGTIMLVGILNVLVPGWHGELLEAFTLS